MHQHVIGRPAGDGVEGHRHSTRNLAEALEAGGVAGIDAQVLGQPIGGYQADPVLGRVRSRGREQGGRDESVDLAHR